MNNKSKLLSLLAVVAIFATRSYAVGVVDTAVQGGIDDAVATWGAVKAALVPIGVFLICYGFFKRLRSA